MINLITRTINTQLIAWWSMLETGKVQAEKIIVQIIVTYSYAYLYEAHSIKTKK